MNDAFDQPVCPLILEKKEFSDKGKSPICRQKDVKVIQRKKHERVKLAYFAPADQPFKILQTAILLNFEYPPQITEPFS